MAHSTAIICGATQYTDINLRGFQVEVGRSRADGGGHTSCELRYNENILPRSFLAGGS